MWTEIWKKIRRGREDRRRYSQRKQHVQSPCGGNENLTKAGGEKE